jgi:hypothetical protein
MTAEQSSEDKDGHQVRATIDLAGECAIGSLFNINLRDVLSLFSSNLFSKKKDRAAFAGGPSQGGNGPGEGPRRRG